MQESKRSLRPEQPRESGFVVSPSVGKPAAWEGLHPLGVLGLLLMVDVVITGIALTAATGAAGLAGPASLQPAAPFSSLGGSMLVVQPLVLALCGAYDALQRLPRARLVAAVILAAVLVLAQAAIGSAATTGELRVLGYYPLFALPLLFAGHAFSRHALIPVMAGSAERRVLVIGDGSATAAVMKLLRTGAEQEVQIVQHLQPARVRGAAADAWLADFGAAVCASEANEVVIASPELEFEAFKGLVDRCFAMGVSVSVAPRFLDGLKVRVRAGKTPSGGTVLQLQPHRFSATRQSIKRSMDLLLSATGMVALAPLFLLVAVAIRLDSPGPIVFRQLRTGLRGRPFWMFKFRTMVADADALKEEFDHLNRSGDARLFKIPGDPRVTRVGRALRASSFDELPQLLNVLSGEMSLIGPRPFFPHDLPSYDSHHFIRLSVLPGITGLWQVSGRSDVLDFDEVVRLDREYIERWSVWLDLRILGRTLPTVLRRSGAY